MELALQQRDCKVMNTVFQHYYYDYDYYYSIIFKGIRLLMPFVMPVNALLLCSGTHLARALATGFGHSLRLCPH